MRTTIDIDEDVLNAAREYAAHEHMSVGAAISALVRESLRGRGRFALLPSRDEIITLEHVRGIRDQEQA